MLIYIHVRQIINILPQKNIQACKFTDLINLFESKLIFTAWTNSHKWKSTADHFCLISIVFIYKIKYNKSY